MNDALLPHLLEIITDPASDGIILAGGFGLWLKQQHLRASGARMLIHEIPSARATYDLDFFLRIELFLERQRGTAFRELLDRLGYEEHTPKWQFGKSELTDTGEYGPRIMVDLLARAPRSDEPVKVKPPRVGADSGTGLHGRHTPEAFAIDDGPIPVHVIGVRVNGEPAEAHVLVPAPYAWLNMKVRAAHDWLRMVRGELAYKPASEKHAADVYILTGMLTREELGTARQHALTYANHPTAHAIKEEAAELFAGDTSRGFVQILDSIPASRAQGAALHPVFWEGLAAALGIEP